MNIDNGFITLHRKIMQWEWYTDNNTRGLFIHLLLIANHKETKWRGEVIRRGQVLTGLDSLSKSTGLSIQEIRTSLSKLKSTGEITNKSTNKYRVITINNYNSYQSVSDNKQQANQQTTQQSSNKQSTAYNNDNNDNKFNNKNTLLSESITRAQEVEVFNGNEGLNGSVQVKSEPKEKQAKFTPPTKRETSDFFLNNGCTNEEAGRFWYHFDSSGWILGNGRQMKSWTSAAHKWILNSNKYSNGNGKQSNIQRDANGLSKQDHYAASQRLLDMVRHENAKRQASDGYSGNTRDESEMLHGNALQVLHG